MQTNFLFIKNVTQTSRLRSQSRRLSYFNLIFKFFTPSSSDAERRIRIISAGFTLNYDPEVLEVSGVNTAPLSEGFFLALGAIHAAVGAFALYRMSKRAPVPLDEQNPMVPVPSGALPVAATLTAKTVRDQMDSDLAAMTRSQMGRG